MPVPPRECDEFVWSNAPNLNYAPRFHNRTNWRRAGNDFRRSARCNGEHNRARDKLRLEPLRAYVRVLVTDL